MLVVMLIASLLAQYRGCPTMRLCTLVLYGFGLSIRVETGSVFEERTRFAWYASIFINFFDAFPGYFGTFYMFRTTLFGWPEVVYLVVCTACYAYKLKREHRMFMAAWNATQN